MNRCRTFEKLHEWFTEKVTCFWFIAITILPLKSFRHWIIYLHLQTWREKSYQIPCFLGWNNLRKWAKNTFLFRRYLASKIFEKYSFSIFGIITIPKKGNHLEYHMPCHTQRLFISKAVSASLISVTIGMMTVDWFS